MCKFIKHLWENRKVIGSAWADSLSGKIPSDSKDWPGWYEKRMKACAACEYNSLNMTYEQRLAKGLKAVGGKVKPQCSICGCAVKEKCWAQTETCSKKEIGLEPEWRHLAVFTEGAEDLSIIDDLSSKDYTIHLSDDATHFEIRVGELMTNTVTPIRFRVKTKKPIFMNQPTASCGCVRNIKLQKVSNKEFIVSCEYNTEGYALGPINYKNISLRHIFSLDEAERIVKIDLVGEIIQNPDKPYVAPEPKK